MKCLYLKNRTIKYSYELIIKYIKLSILLFYLNLIIILYFKFK